MKPRVSRSDSQSYFSYSFVLPALFSLVLHHFWYRSEDVIMATRSGRSFRGRLTDSQCDEMVI